MTPGASRIRAKAKPYLSTNGHHAGLWRRPTVRTWARRLGEGAVFLLVLALLWGALVVLGTP